MRQIILDTETTGLELNRGHRVIEIGCVELFERRRTGREFHRYLNPERGIDAGAQAKHGLTEEFLADKPLFAQIAAEFLAFVDGAELVIHNAAFDVGFLDAELARLPGASDLGDRCTVLDTLQLARSRYPGQKNSLDALCKRLSVDNAHRQLHGALVDAHLLTEVYLALTAGQGDLGFASAAEPAVVARTEVRVSAGRLRVQCADAGDLARHRSRLQGIDRASGGQCLWLLETT
ncbi:MAG: DNA polymerase III subunit epsilon [Lysobacterales bacterium]